MADDRNYTDAQTADATNPDAGVRMIEVFSQANDDLPGGCLLRVLGQDADGVLLVSTPTVDNEVGLLVNFPHTIPAGGYGQAHQQFPASVLYEAGEGTPAVGDEWGAKAGDPKLHPRQSGYVVKAVGATEYVVVEPTTSAVGGLPDVRLSDSSVDVPNVTRLEFNVANFTEFRVAVGDALIGLRAVTMPVVTNVCLIKDGGGNITGINVERTVVSVLAASSIPVCTPSPVDCCEDGSGSGDCGPCGQFCETVPTNLCLTFSSGTGSLSGVSTIMTKAGPDASNAYPNTWFGNVTPDTPGGHAISFAMACVEFEGMWHWGLEILTEDGQAGPFYADTEAYVPFAVGWTAYPLVVTGAIAGWAGTYAVGVTEDMTACDSGSGSGDSGSGSGDCQFCCGPPATVQLNFDSGFACTNGPTSSQTLYWNYGGSLCGWGAVEIENSLTETKFVLTCTLDNMATLSVYCRSWPSGSYVLTGTATFTVFCGPMQGSGSITLAGTGACCAGGPVSFTILGSS